jgi:protein-S-isoprenylcysteine O-methyltransferase Ste14
LSENHADVLVRPPNLYLGGLIASCLLELLWPLGPGLAAGNLRPVIIGLVLSVIGAGMIWKAVRQFTDAGTTIPVDEPTDALVTHGLYGWSRNPIYVGLTTIYVGLSIALTTGWALLVLPILLMVMSRGVIDTEEAYLSQEFGTPYKEYKEKVPRWL